MYETPKRSEPSFMPALQRNSCSPLSHARYPTPQLSHLHHSLVPSQHHSQCSKCRVAVTTILDLPEGREVAIVGTLYKDMKLKPSILDEYNKVAPLLLSSYLAGQV